MSYRTNPLVICKEIANTFYLLSTRDAWGACPYILQISNTAALFWNDLVKGTPKDVMIDNIVSEYEVSRKTVQKDLDQFIEQLLRYHYLEKQEGPDARN